MTPRAPRRGAPIPVARALPKAALARGNRPSDAGPFVGAHCSIAGGLKNAILAAAELRCHAVQIFVKNSNQWRGRAMEEADIDGWKETLAAHPMFPVVHDSYLINLASPDPRLLDMSREAFLDETRRCERLGITRLIFHPGAHMGAGEESGIATIAASLDWICDRTSGSRVVLAMETTAGHGTVLGGRFEHLAGILDRVRYPERLGVCVDTCHIFAAGYDFRTPKGYDAVFAGLASAIGLDRVVCFHVNDSKRDLGSRVDRHENLGKGYVGSRAFGFLMRDPRFAGIPKIIETPKEGDWDKKNLALLRRLSRRS